MGFAAVELPDPGECGVPAIPPMVRSSNSRIVGGTQAKPHSWPWQVRDIDVHSTVIDVWYAIAVQSRTYQIMSRTQLPNWYRIRKLNASKSGFANTVYPDNWHFQSWIVLSYAGQFTTLGRPFLRWVNFERELGGQRGPLRRAVSMIFQLKQQVLQGCS